MEGTSKSGRPLPLWTFFQELKRRRVFRVLLAYLVSGWVLIEVAETTFPYVGFHDRFVTLVIVVVVAGLPVALVLAWVFDITPGGLETTAPLDPDGPADPPGRQAAPRLEITPTSGAPASLDVTAPPVPATSMVGREEELGEAERLLGEEEVRLLTLVGPGGSGKTRLAVEVARRMQERLGDGVAWVPLESVRDPALVPSAIRQALGIGEAGGEALTATIAAALKDRELLLALDNFEQVVEAADHVAALLGAVPGLRVLVTSRAPLRLRGERELHVLPLSVGAASRSPSALRDSPAVRLFAERARAVNPSFELTDDTVLRVAAICRRLDGLPLALELAAARSKILSPEVMLTRLEQRMPVLGPGARDHAPHQRTLQDTIGWSYDLLEPAQRALFQRLAVFAGGADLEAVQAVAGPDAEWDVLETLHSLVDQSLVASAAEGGPRPRFTMLQVIREFAAEALEASDDEVEVRNRHAAHFFDLTRESEPELVGPGQAAWLDRLEEEHENLRAALGWLERSNPEGALQLAVLLWRFWEMKGHLTEGRRRLDELLKAVPSPREEKLRLKALYAAGVLADAHGDYAAARDYFEESLRMNREAGDRWGLANALNNMGVIALRHGQHEEATRLYTESASLWRELGNDAAVALALNNLGNAARLRGNHEAARLSLEESLAMQRSAGDVNGCGLTLGLLAEVARDEDFPVRAHELYEESLACFQKGGNRPQIAHTLLAMGGLHHQAGRMDEARGRFAEALLTYGEVGSPRGLAEVLERLAALARDLGDEERSARFLEVARGLNDRAQDFEDEDAIEEAYAWASLP